MPMIEEDRLRLFAHLHLDHRLRGSYLEGSTFSVTVRYILDALKEQDLSDAQMTSIFQDLVDNEVLLGQAQDSVRKKVAENREVYSLYSLNERENLADLWLRKLKENKQILIPGGWMGVEQASGHELARCAC